MPFELFIAIRYLRAKRKEGFISLITFLSVAGVAVGVMALVVVISVMSGAEKDFRKKILGLEPHILVMNYSGKFGNYSPLLSELKQIKGVQNISPLFFGQTMIRTAHAFSGAMLRGVDTQSDISLIKGFSPEELKRALGKDRSGTNLPGIILGGQLADSVGAAKGDNIILLSPAGILSPAGYMPSMQRFHVEGTFSSGMYEYDSAIAYVHIDEAQKHAGIEDKISAIGIWVDNVFNVKAFKKEVLSHIEAPFYARDWMEINKSLFSALKLEKTAMFIILTLIVLVAAFNIASALIMMVMEKTKDVAVLKAMGATDRMVGKIFIIKGLIIGFAGTVAGAVSGIAICFLLQKYKFIHLPEAYPFTTLPVDLNSLDVCIIALASMGICFVSTLYPSRKASKMNPVEALRYG